MSCNAKTNGIDHLINTVNTQTLAFGLHLINWTVYCRFLNCFGCSNDDFKATATINQQVLQGKIEMNEQNIQ